MCLTVVFFFFVLPNIMCCMLNGEAEIHEQITVKLYFKMLFMKTNLSGQYVRIELVYNLF